MDCFGYVRAKDARDFERQETLVRAYAVLHGHRVAFLYSDRESAGQEGLKSSLASVEQGGVLIASTRSAIGTYRHINSLRKRVESKGGTLVIVEDSFRVTNDSQAKLAKKLADAIADYREEIGQ